MVIFLRRLFSDRKIILVYSNALNQLNLSCPVNDGSNRTAYKTCLNFRIETHKTQASHRGVVAIIIEGQ